MQTRDTVVAVFDERHDVQDAINAHRDAGFRDAGFMAEDIANGCRQRIEDDRRRHQGPVVI